MLAILKHPLMNLDAYPQITTKTDMLNVLKLNITKMSFDELSLHLNPNLFSLHNLAEEECTYDAEGNFVWPQLLGLNYESIQEENGIYLLDDGIQIIIHFTYSIDRTQLRAIFGIDAPENIQLPIDEHQMCLEEGGLSEKVRNLLAECRYRHSSNHSPLYISISGTGTEQEAEFYFRMIEDKYDSYSTSQYYHASYNEFWVTLHSGPFSPKPR